MHVAEEFYGEGLGKRGQDIPFEGPFERKSMGSGVTAQQRGLVVKVCWTTSPGADARVPPPGVGEPTVGSTVSFLFWGFMYVRYDDVPYSRSNGR